MFNKGAILVNPYYYGEDIAYLVKRLTAEFDLLAIKIDTIKCQALFTHIKDGDVVVEDFSYDFVIYLDKDKYLACLLETAGYRLFNKAQNIEVCDDKMKSYLALSNQGINMPLTIPGPLCYVTAEPDGELMERVIATLGFPLVIKGAYGSMGKNIYLVKNRKELFSKAKELIKKPHLYQKYIASSHGQDIRVIVINKKACAAMLRKSAKDFRSNLAIGGQAFKVDLSGEYITLAEKVATILDLDYCGVDILIGENQEPIFCEVNSNAFITGIERVTGINVAAVYCHHIMKEIYGKD